MDGGQPFTTLIAHRWMPEWAVACVGFCAMVSSCSKITSRVVPAAKVAVQIGAETGDTCGKLGVVTPPITDAQASLNNIL